MDPRSEEALIQKREAYSIGRTHADRGTPYDEAIEPQKDYADGRRDMFAEKRLDASSEW